MEPDETIVEQKEQPKEQKCNYIFQLVNVDSGKLIFQSEIISYEQMNQIVATFENTDGGIRKIRAKNSQGVPCIFREEHFDKLFLKFQTAQAQ